MKKTLAFGIVLLFIGVAFAPSLYADVETDNYNITMKSDIEITDISYRLCRVVATIKNNGLTDVETDVQFSYFQYGPGGLVTLPIILGHHQITIPANGIAEVSQFFGGFGRKRMIVMAEGESLSSDAIWLWCFGLKLN